MTHFTQIACLLAMLAISGTIYAQSAKTRQKDNVTAVSMTKSQVNEKATKAARKEAKRLAKEGWLVAPGALPLEKQLDKSYSMQYEYDENMLPKYIMSEAMSVGENYDAAKMQALELARQNLAGQIQTELTAMIENSVANEQLQAEQAASITRSVMAAKSYISQNIGRTITVTEAYRKQSNKNTEVLVRIAYNSDMAFKAAKKAIRQELEKRGDNLHNQLDLLLWW